MIAAEELCGALGIGGVAPDRPSRPHRLRASRARASRAHERLSKGAHESGCTRLAPALRARASGPPTAVEINKKYVDFGAVTIEGVGHHRMLEKPDEFNPKLRDVLKELRPRSVHASPGTGPGRRTGGTKKGGTRKVRRSLQRAFRRQINEVDNRCRPVLKS
jgi:hypothetical protein